MARTDSRSNGRPTLGAQPSVFNTNVSITPGQNYADPYISVQGDSYGDTVYYLLHNIFDPRVSSEYSEGNAYSLAKPGRDYIGLFKDMLLFRIFDERPGRQEPSDAVIDGIIANIVDISRMYGILLTALTLKESRDPEMYQRARSYGLHNTYVDMQTMLAYLPLPKVVAQLNQKYVRLMDVASQDAYQNVGFLVNGSYDTFLQLHANVRNRRSALAWMRTMFPDIGVVGNPASGFDADVMHAFVNANIKFTQDNVNYLPFQNVQGSSGEYTAMASAGVLHCAFDLDTLSWHTLTGWGLPGSGNSSGVASTIRTPAPFLCTYDPTVGLDAAIIYDAGFYAVSNTANVVTAQTIADPALAANLGHEYNLASGLAAQPGIMINPIEIDLNSGILDPLVQDNMTFEDTRYRASAGFSLGELSYRLDGNLMSMLAAMIS